MKGTSGSGRPRPEDRIQLHRFGGEDWILVGEDNKGKGCWLILGKKARTFNGRCPTLAEREQKKYPAAMDRVSATELWMETEQEVIILNCIPFRKKGGPKDEIWWNFSVRSIGKIRKGSKVPFRNLRTGAEFLTDGLRFMKATATTAQIVGDDNVLDQNQVAFPALTLVKYQGQAIPLRAKPGYRVCSEEIVHSFFKKMGKAVALSGNPFAKGDQIAKAVEETGERFSLEAIIGKKTEWPESITLSKKDWQEMQQALASAGRNDLANILKPTR